MIRILLLFSALVCGNGLFAQSKDCLKYEPELVKVSGVVERDIFPGRPNYESIKDGDEPEVYWVLKLSKSICVIGKSDDDINESENNIVELQLILTDNQYKQYHGYIGHKVIVSGTLFHSITAHHKTTVLINVVKMVAA
jgi:hypothetical protein